MQRESGPTHRRRCRSTTANRLTITPGGMQGLDLFCKLFVDPGDLVVVESPTHTNGSATALSYGAQLLEVPVDDDGMIVDDPQRLLDGRRPKAIYTIPTFQNPNGATLSLERAGSGCASPRPRRTGSTKASPDCTEPQTNCRLRPPNWAPIRTRPVHRSADRAGSTGRRRAQRSRPAAVIDWSTAADSAWPRKSPECCHRQASPQRTLVRGFVYVFVTDDAGG
jgi:hypothetical protein